MSLNLSLRFWNRSATFIWCIFASFTISAQTNYSGNFDGTDDDISVPHSSALNVTNFTFEAWIKLNDAGSARTIISKGDGSPSSTNYVFNISAAAGNSRMGLFVGDEWYSATTALSTGVWYHAAVTVSGTSVQFYLNGSPDGSATVVGSVYTGGTYLFKIGEQGEVCSCNQLNGMIDEVRVWNVVRTAPQIRAQMFTHNFSASSAGLVAYYRFNEGSGTSIANATGTSGINGTLNNGTGWSASQIQYAGNALHFTGANYVEMNSRLTVGTANFTLEAWVYPTSTGAGMVFAQDICGDGNHQYRLYTFNNRAYFDLSDNSANGAPFSFQMPSAVNSVPINTWTHVAAVRNGNNYVMYINGVQSATQTTGANTINNLSGSEVGKRLRIGSRGGASGGCGTNNFIGNIDEVRVWNVARTAAEVQASYTTELDPLANNNLVSYYSFNQGISNGTNTGLSRLMDIKGGNNGTLNGFGLTGSTSNWVVQNATIAILPLQWISFTAQQQHRNVLLKWSTALEVNVVDFVVERQLRDNQWQQIGQVTAAGGSDVNEYSYLDVSPEAGTNYYRIMQVDRDGKRSFSEIRAVRFDAAASSFTVINNPVRHGVLQIRVDNPRSTAFKIFDAQGRLLFSTILSSGTHTLSPTQLSSGIYLLTDGLRTQKIVVSGR